MVDKFIKAYAKKISLYPEYIEVKESINEVENICNVVIYADDSDMGRLIGKNGKMISSIKALVSGCKAKNGISYKVVVEAAR